MIDTAQLLQALSLNGINKGTSMSEIDKTLTALRYSPEEKQKAFQILKAQGWGIAEPVSAPVVNPVPAPAPAPTPVARPVPIAPLPPKPPVISIPQVGDPAPVPAPMYPSVVAPKPVTPPVQPVQPVQPIRPIQPVQPPVQPIQPVQTFQPARTVFNAPVTPITSAPAKKHFLLYTIIIVVILLVIGGIVYAATSGMLSFTKSDYTPDNFFSTLLSKASTINSAAYKGSFSLDVGKRDSDAAPFQVVVTNTAALREQYQNDSERAKSVSDIISLISGGYYNKPASYPSSIKNALQDAVKKNSYLKNTVVADPLTNKEYSYKTIDGGKDFNLTVVFETDNAIKTIRQSYKYTATSTPINGKSVTFTKNSTNYFYLPTEPAKPFLVQIGESMQSIPADIKVSFDVGAQTDFTSASTMADWLAQFNAEGAFGDLTYKVNAEARKKDSNYYFRINNIPSLFGSYSSLKGQWIKVSATPATSTVGASTYNQFDSITKSLQSSETTYKQERQAFVTIMRKAAEIADQENLVTFKNNPKKETVDGRDLTRYDLQINKAAILPFYQKLLAEVNKDKKLNQYGNVTDQGLVEYLQSDEFNQVYDYINKNVQFIFWADSSGYPAIFEEKMRIVPPNTVVQFKDKQMNLTFKLSFNDINKPVNIDVPPNARLFSDIMAEFNDSQYGYDTSGEGKIKSNLVNIRSQAEVVYMNSKNSYGNKAFALGACKQTVGTMFADKDLFKLIQGATNNVPSKATCISQGSTGKVSSYAVSAPLTSDPTYSWCIDSGGSSKQIKGAVKSVTCK